MAADSLPHLNPAGQVWMVDVTDRNRTNRVAVATGRLMVNTAVIAALTEQTIPKGDALAVARIAAITGAKRTADLIPLCHPIELTAVETELTVTSDSIDIRVTCRVAAATGVEMEAMTGVAIAGLTVYDMVKAIDPAAVLTDVRLESKTGGRSGEWTRG